MSFQGNLIGWVAIHRRHHAFTDRPGDPHSPTGTAPARAGSWSPRDQRREIQQSPASTTSPPDTRRDSAPSSRTSREVGD
ncbi:hypothetical protein [Nonomuraea sp. JJY05]|uniref:hypothetical protein n=1 Tax=Nonomuraea sp. JJY05 TaxID=3350255 RepID=UPI00373F6FB0